MPDVQGNCKSQPSAAELGLAGTAGLQDWQAGQCVIVTDVRLMSVFQNLWLHGLYIRHHATTRTGTESWSVVWCGSKDCNLWMTDVTIQGDGSKDSGKGALHVSGGQVYAEGVALSQCQSTVTHMDHIYNIHAPHGPRVHAKKRCKLY